MRFLPALAAPMIMLAAVSDAHACSCGSSGPPCQNFFQVDAVFVGTVTTISPAADQNQKLRVQFADVRPIKGVQGLAVSILTASDGAECGYGFERGDSYVVYAHQPKGGAGLEAGGNSRVSGSINHWEQDLATGETRTYGPVRDILLTLRGEGGTFEARSDDQGLYHVAVPPGMYELNASPPDGFSARYLRKIIDLPDANACYVADFDVHYDGRVRGSVRTSTGQPATEAPVEMVPMERLGGGREFVTPSAEIDAAGNFEFREVPPGRYLVGVDLTRRMDATIVFPRTFHPGTLDTALATVVELKGSERRDLAPMFLPPARRALNLPGMVTFEDGTPVSAVSISLLDGEGLNAEQVAEATSGIDGLFSLSAHEGLIYAASAWYRVSANPRARSLRAEIGSFVASDQTKPLHFVLPRVPAIQPAPEVSPQAVKEDFDALWRYAAENYAYFDDKAIAWSSIPQLYAGDLDRVRTRQDFVVVLERLVEELYDHHAHLTTNTAESPRLVPSGTDIWAAWQNGRAIVLEVRAGSDAGRAGIKASAVILSINGVPNDKAIDGRLGRALSRADDAARSWALRALLAGRRSQARVIAFTHNGTARTVELPAREQAYVRDGRLAFRVLAGNRGYIRIHDSLGDSDLIADFDKALAALRGTSALCATRRAAATPPWRAAFSVAS